MFKKAVNKAITPLGYEFRRKVSKHEKPPSLTPNDAEFTLHKYLKQDGTFDYEMYRSVQEEGNKRKIDRVWVLEENIAFLSRYLKKRLGKVSLGICHGTRRGVEQEWFRKYLGRGAEVIGTEISETATQFPNTIQWDFHKVKPEWKNNTDFIYSNSFDHSYDPEKCLKAWMSCLRPGGLCIIEHTDGHHASGANKLDPFGAHLVQMPYLISKWGEGRFGVRDILTAPAKNKHLQYTAFIVVQNFEDKPAKYSRSSSS